MHLAGLLSLAILTLVACQKISPTGIPASGDAQSANIAMLQHINRVGVTCWFRSKDPAFSSYRLIPELDTKVGKPRILLLEKNQAQGLPVLVIEAQSKPVSVETYGPLSSSATGSRINSDIKRWASGSQTC